MRSGEGTIQIIEVLKEFSIEVDSEEGKVEKQVVPGAFIPWLLEHTSDSLGNTISGIRFRSEYFENYLQNRMSEKEIWDAKLRMARLAKVGEYVVIPIGKEDRTSTDPKNCLAKVLELMGRWPQLELELASLNQNFNLLNSMFSEATPAILKILKFPI